MIAYLLAGLSLFNAVSVSFPIEPSGEAYVGKYFNKAETPKELQYNIDVGMEISLDLFDVAGQRLFILYRDDLMSGNDFGANVTFDPRMAHFDLTAGFRFDILG